MPGSYQVKGLQWVTTDVPKLNIGAYLMEPQEPKESQLQVFSEPQLTRLEHLQKDIELITEMMSSILKDGQHYGVIPGCGNKPALLKAGAEKLCTAFRLAAKYEITKTNLSNEHREYEIVTSLIHIPTGNFVGQGVGTCTTMESKYRYRNAKRVCPDCGQETIIKGKAEYGGGWICWQKPGVSDGCNAKFPDGSDVIENQAVGKVDNENIADEYNTVLKIAKKRSLVDGVLNCTAASDLFTQDIEEKGKSETQETPKPNSNSSEQPSSNGNSNGNKIDPNAVWGIINEKIRSLQKGITGKEEMAVREIVIEIADKDVVTNITKDNVDDIVRQALEKYFGNT